MSDEQEIKNQTNKKLEFLSRTYHPIDAQLYLYVVKF